MTTATLQAATAAPAEARAYPTKSRQHGAEAESSRAARRPYASPEMMTIVEAVLDADVGLTPGEVHSRIGRWARASVRHALRELVAQGRATFEGPDCQRHYRKPRA